MAVSSDPLKLSANKNHPWTVQAEHTKGLGVFQKLNEILSASFIISVKYYIIYILMYLCNVCTRNEPEHSLIVLNKKHFLLDAKCWDQFKFFKQMADHI